MKDNASQTLPTIVRPIIETFIDRLKEIVPVEHFYVHGSVAMGGFHPDHSDLDFLIVTSRPLSVEERLALIHLCLTSSNDPYPIELSVLTVHELGNWQHPSPFEFHYSEGWRTRFELAPQSSEVLTLQSGLTDRDLAAHVRITCERGITLYGRSLKSLLTGFKEEDYRDAIMSDARDCLDSIHDAPVYSVLNLTRVLAYCGDQLVLSKQEAFKWSERRGFASDVSQTVAKAAGAYAGEEIYFAADELDVFHNFVRTHLSLK